MCVEMNVFCVTQNRIMHVGNINMMIQCRNINPDQGFAFRQCSPNRRFRNRFNVAERFLFSSCLSAFQSTIRAAALGFASSRESFFISWNCKASEYGKDGAASSEQYFRIPVAGIFRRDRNPFVGHTIPSSNSNGTWALCKPTDWAIRCFLSRW